MQEVRFVFSHQFYKLVWPGEQSLYIEVVFVRLLEGRHHHMLDPVVETPGQGDVETKDMEHWQHSDCDILEWCHRLAHIIHCEKVWIPG